MPNEATKAFRRMMLNSRLNQLMTNAVEEGIAATEAARKAQEQGRVVNPTQGPATKGAGTHAVTTEATEKGATQKDHAQLRQFMRPIYFTPKDKKPRQQQTEAELDEEFRIPDYVLKGEPKPKD